MTEDEMIWRYHRLSGHEFEQTLGDGKGQGSKMSNTICYHLYIEKGKATHSKYSGLENSMDCIVHGVSYTWNLKYGTNGTKERICETESWIQRTDLRLTVKAGG